MPDKPLLEQSRELDPVQFAFADDGDAVFTFEVPPPKEKGTARFRRACAFLCAILFGASLFVTLSFCMLLGTATREDSYYEWFRSLHRDEYEELIYTLMVDYRDLWFQQADWLGGSYQGQILEATAFGLSREMAETLIRENLPGALAYLTGQSDRPPTFTTQSVAEQWRNAVDARLGAVALETGTEFFSVVISSEETEAMLSGARDMVGTLLSLRFILIAFTFVCLAAAFFLEPVRWQAARRLSLAGMVASVLLVCAALVGSMIPLLPGALGLVGRLLAQSLLAWPLVLLAGSSVLFLVSRVMLSRKSA